MRLLFVLYMIKKNNGFVWYLHRITAKDLPKEKDWNKAAVEVRLKLYENMRNINGRDVQ